MSRKCQPSGDVALNDLDPSRDNFFFFPYSVDQDLFSPQAKLQEDFCCCY